MKRFVVLSDLHAHPWAAFSSGDGLQNSRLQRSLNILWESLKCAQDEGIPWLFPGDIIHTAGFIGNSVLSGIIAILMEFPDVPKIAVWGNHDVRGVGGRISLEETIWYSLAQTVPNLTVLDDSTIELQGLTIYGAGYQPRLEFLNLGEGADIGLFHQTVLSSVTPSGYALTEGIPGKELHFRYELSIVGHVHHKQQMESPGTKGILIPGSPEHHNFGDQGEHGWWIVSFGPPHDLEFMLGNSPQFLTVDLPGEVQVDENFYRVRNVLDKDDLPENATFIAPEPTTVEHRDLLRDASQVEEIIEVWLKESPPLEGSDIKRYSEVGRDLLGAQDPTRLRFTRAKHLTLTNFGSYENQEFPIDDGLWLVTGKGKDYPSNGAGKSTLAGEALYWLIFGKTTKDSATDEVIRGYGRAPGISRCQVSGLFELEDGFLSVTRTRDLNQGPSLNVLQGVDLTEDNVWVGGESWEAKSITEMTQKLTRFLGITPEIFQFLAYFSQEKLLLFSSATDGERKDVLADIGGLSSYQEASSAAASEVSIRETTLGQKRAVLETRKEDVLSEQQTLLLSKEALSQWEGGREIALEGLRQDLTAVQADPRVNGHRAKVEALKGRIQALLDRKIIELRTRVPIWAEEFLQGLQARNVENLGKIQEQRQTTLGHLVELGWEEATARGLVQVLPDLKEKAKEEKARERKADEVKIELGTQRREADITLQGLRKQLTTAEKVLKEAREVFAEGLCPTCHQAVSQDHQESCLSAYVKGVASLHPSITEAEAKVESLTAGREEAFQVWKTAGESHELLSTKVTNLEAAKGWLDWLDEYQRQETEIEVGKESLVMTATESAERTYQVNVQAYQERKAIWVRKIDDFFKRESDRWTREIQDAEKVLQAKTEESNPHLTEERSSSERLEKLQQHLEALREEISVTVEEVALYEYWVKGFSKQGLQSLQMEEIASRFNAFRGLILPPLTQGIYDVQFSTTSRTRAGDLREKTDFFVYKNGEQIPYRTLSGGERRRVDVGILLTLVYAVSDWMRIPGILGILVLDEVFTFLDSSGAEGLMEALLQIQEKVPAIFTMTHDNGLQSLFPDMIRVVQGEDGISRVA